MPNAGAQAATSFRRITPDQTAPDHTAPDHMAPSPMGQAGRLDLPPIGTSPAGDLQHRLAEAALRNFYAPSPTSTRSWGRRRRLAAAVLAAVGSWGLVFSIGAMLLQG